MALAVIVIGDIAARNFDELVRRFLERQMLQRYHMEPQVSFVAGSDTHSINREKASTRSQLSLHG